MLLLSGVIYSGNNPVSRPYRSWQKDCLVLSGSGQYVLAENILNSSGKTLEVVYKYLGNGNQFLIGTSTAGIGIKNNKLVGKLNLGNGKTSGIIDGSSIKSVVSNGKIYSSALTYDGKNLKIYNNGKCVGKSQSMKTEAQSVTTLSAKTIVGSGYTIKTGLKAYIGKTTDHDSRSGITIEGYIDDSAGYTSEGVEFYKYGPNTPASLIWVDGNTNPQYGSSYYKNIADMDQRTDLKMRLSVSYGANVHEVDMDNTYIGVPSQEASSKEFTVVAKGSDSIVLKSNIGKVDDWLFSTSGAEPQPRDASKSVEIFGDYYYSFEDLTPGASYTICAKYSIDKDLGENDFSSNVYVGKDYENNFDYFKGLIYVVRAYDMVLTEDAIKTNFNKDKALYGIVED